MDKDISLRMILIIRKNKKQKQKMADERDKKKEQKLFDDNASDKKEGTRLPMAKIIWKNTDRR